MSYCRWSDESDVYVYAHCMGGLVCCHTDGTGSSFTAHTGAEMIAHLEEHRAKGDKVPQRAIDRIRAEALEGKRWSVPGGYPGHLKRKVPVGRARRGLTP